jgi:hypothetical protein
MQTYPASGHFLSLRSKYSPRYPVLKHPQVWDPVILLQLCPLSVVHLINEKSQILFCSRLHVTCVFVLTAVVLITSGVTWIPWFHSQRSH